MIDMYDVTKMTALEEKEFMKTLGAEYRQSYNKISKEIEDFVEKHGIDKDQMTEAMFRKYNRLQSLEKQLGSTIDDMNKSLNPKLKGYLGKVYEKNFYGAGYALEKAGKINLSYSKLDSGAITRSILTDYDNIALKYNAKEVKKKIANSVNQSIIRGESISDLTKRLKVDLGQNGNRAVRIARTSTNRVMGGSRFDSFKHASQNGLELKKVWVSTLDSRTRTSHQTVDGETIELDDKFSIGVMYPSDPSGSPSQTINCRCTMITDIVSGYGNEPMPEDMTLDDWIENLLTPNAVEEMIQNPTSFVLESEFKGTIITDKSKAMDISKLQLSKLDKSHFDALDKYVYETKSFTINDRLREDVTKKNGEVLKGYDNAVKGKSVYLETIDALTEAIEKSVLPEDLVLTRRVRYIFSELSDESKELYAEFYKATHYRSGEFVDSMKDKFVADFNAKAAGTIYKDRGFVSTSYNPAGNIFQDRKMELEIRARKGQNGLFVDGLNKNVHEAEVILNRNSEYRILELTRTKDDGYKMIVELVESGGKHNG